jgi:hypothetical protein
VVKRRKKGKMITMEKLTNGFACGGIMRVKRDERKKRDLSEDKKITSF